MTQAIYAVGDVHGELDQLEQAIATIERDGGSDARIVLLGDYVDRGPDSRGVIDYLIEALATGKRWTCLLGNHDRMFALFMQEVPQSDLRLRVRFSWLHDRLGGKDTLASYCVEASDDDTLLAVHTHARAAVPQAHLDFLASLPYHYQADELLFVHAGIRPGIALEQQDRDDLIWIRDEFHRDEREHPWLVVHGHTPVDAATHYGNRVNLDTGAGYGKALSTAVFEQGRCWLLEDGGRRELLPAR